MKWLLNTLRSWFILNGEVSIESRLSLRVFWFLVLCLFWHFTPVLPPATEMLRSLVHLTLDSGLLGDVFTSLSVHFRSVAITFVVAMLLIYLTALPVVRPVVEFVGKLRFIAPASLIVPVIIYFADDSRKVFLLTFGMTVFIVADLCASILKDREIEAAKDRMRIIRCPEWKVTREVIIYSTLPMALRSLQVAAAMSITMLTLVESLVQSSGGLGVVFLRQERNMHLAGMIPPIIIGLFVGIGQDSVFVLGRHFACPWARKRK